MNAYLQRDPNTGVATIKTVGNSKTETIYAQGLGQFNMNSSDTYVKFVIYEGDPRSLKYLDLTGLGKLYINFYADSGEIKKFLNYSSAEVSAASGEVLFKIPQKDAARISEYTDHTFTITNETEEDETQIYTGVFLKVGDSVGGLKERKIANQEKQLEELNEAFIGMKALYKDQTAKRIHYYKLLRMANSQIATLRTALRQEVQENKELIQDDASDEQQKKELLARIEELEALASKPPEVITQTITVVDPDCPKQKIQPSKRESNMKTSKSGPFSTISSKGKQIKDRLK